MKTLFRAGVLAALLCGGAGGMHAQAQTNALPSVTLPTALDRVLRDYERAWAAGDAAALSALFDETGFALPSGSLPARGRPAIRAQYAGSTGELQLRAVAYATADTIGYIVGMFGYPGRPDAGKFLLALRRPTPDSPWLIAADMDNPNSRPGGPP